jgi:hypothetical protein
MALTQCKECDCSISDRAAACPHCGAPGALLATSRPSLSGTGRVLAVSCAVAGVVWALLVIVVTTARVNASYIMPPTYASRMYNEATMGLAGLMAVMLAVILLIYSGRRS